MSRSRPFLALMLAGILGTHGTAISKERLDSVGSMDVPFLARPALTEFTVPAWAAAQLPNGASSIRETYGNWVVGCRLTDGHKKCLLSQTQISNESNQPAFEIELQIPMNGNARGIILMPLGLKLATGAALKVDDTDLVDDLHFSTCISSGCLALVSFPPMVVGEMKNGKVLTVTSLNLRGEVVAFNVSPDGFAAAIARGFELGRWKPATSSMMRGVDGE